MRKPNKKLTFNFFDFKWKRVPAWARDTEEIYRRWYLERYGYKNLNDLKNFLKNKKYIMEAGCGLARDSKMFAELNPKARIFAIDQSHHAVKFSKRTLKKIKNCKVIKADITNFKLDNKFDFISCDQALHHTPDPSKTLKHLFDKLNPGGVINFSVCKIKNKYRELVDNVIMKKAENMSPKDLWEFSRVVTKFGKALYGLNINDVNFENKKYENLQRFVHNHVFRCWYRPDIDFELSVSSNYDWFSGNPRFSGEEVKNKIMKSINSYKILRFYEDDATISVSLQKLNG